MLIRVIAFVCLLWKISLVDAANIDVRDDTAFLFKLDNPPERVISLAPNITEILFAIGAKQKIVGVSTYSDFPPEARNLPVVGTSFKMDEKAIIALKPDLLVAWYEAVPLHVVHRFRAEGIPVYVANFSSIEDIPKAMINLGQLLGTSDQASRAAKEFQAKIDELRATYARLPKIRVFFQVASSGNFFFTENDQSVVGNIINLCGGANIFAHLRRGGAVYMGSVIAGNPDVIIASQGNTTVLDDWIKWPKLKVVHYNNLFTIPASLIVRPGPRIWQGAQLMCQDLEISRQRIGLNGTFY